MVGNRKQGIYEKQVLKIFENQGKLGLAWVKHCVSREKVGGLPCRQQTPSPGTWVKSGRREAVAGMCAAEDVGMEHTPEAHSWPSLLWL